MNNSIIVDQFDRPLSAGLNGHQGPSPEFRSAAEVLIERLRWAREVGLTFNGARDLYNVLGYDRLLTTRQYRGAYQRGGLAGRIIDVFPNSTWRGEEPFDIVEDEDLETDTPFEKDWKEFSKRLQVPAKFLRVDKLSRLSTFAVLLIGTSTSGDLSSPLPRGTSQKQIIYLSPYLGGGGTGGSQRSRTVSTDADATVATYVENTADPRFGLPLTYNLKRTDIIAPQLDKPVHWTRILHIAEGLLDDDIFGQPALERVWNLIVDLDKVTGGGAEAFWLRANQGLHLNLDKDMAVGDVEKQIDSLKQQSEDYKHQLTRWLRTRGVDVTTLGSDVANFFNPADAIITQIAGALGIPKRILTGSEMGELASSQDRENWRDQVIGRQTTYAGPYIVRPLIDRLIEFGYLIPPGDKGYTVKWPHIQVLTEAEKVEGAKGWAAVNATHGSTVFTDDEIRDKWAGFPPLTDDQLAKIDEQNQKKVQDAANAAVTMQTATGGPDTAQQSAQKTAKKQAEKDNFPRAAEGFDYDETLEILAAAIEDGNFDHVEQIIKSLGDVPGHEFHGNQWTDGGATGIVAKEFRTTGYGPGHTTGQEQARAAAKEAHKQLTKAGFVKKVPTEHIHHPGQKMGRSTAYTGSSKSSETHYEHPDGRTAILKTDYQKYRESRVVVRHSKPATKEETHD